jgi:hypothetical protein
MRTIFLLAAFALVGYGQSISITTPVNNATVSGPTTLSATCNSCPSAVRFEWRINGQPLMGDGTFGYSYSIPTCNGGTCSSSYLMPNGFGPYNMSYNWDGVHSLTVMALDASGAVLATSPAISIRVNDQGFGACSLTSPNFSVAQSGIVSITIHCPVSNIPPSSVWSNAYYTFYVDGKNIGNLFQTGYPDATVPFDTTTLENGANHLVWVAVTSSTGTNLNPGSGGQSPILGVWGNMTTANASHPRELRLNYNKVYLWLGGVTTASLFARTTNDDNSESPTNATFTTSDATVAAVAGCSSVVSCTITGVGAGVATITATGSNGLIETAIVTVMAGPPVMPHFGADGSICTAYNEGNCAPNKSLLVHTMFDPNDSTNTDTTLRAEMVRANWNVFQHSVYPNPAYNSYPSVSSFQTESHGYFAGPNGINAILASGFKGFMANCSSMFQDGMTGQSTSDGNGASSDGQGFAARVAYLMTDMQGKAISCLSPDEDPIPIIRGFGTGQMGTANSPSQIVVSGGIATITWPGASGLQYHIDITGATNTCFNATDVVASGGIGGPFTFATSCGNGTYNSSTDPNLVISIYNELCPSHPCQSYPPLNISIPNSILQTIQTALHAATPPVPMGFSWMGGAPKALYSIAATVADYTDAFWTWSGPENGGVNRGYPSGRLVRVPLLSMENHFWKEIWPGIDRTKPFYMLVHSGGAWFQRGGKSYTLGGTSGSQFTTTVANNAAVGAKVTVTGANCTGKYFDVGSVQSTTTFTVTQSAACTGSGGTIIIAPTNLFFTPPTDRYNQPPFRGIEVAAQLWDAVALGAAGNRTFNYEFKSSGCNVYPANATDTYNRHNTPPDNPNGEVCNTGLTYNFRDNPSAMERWNANSLTQKLMTRLEPQIIQPLCNAPDLGPRIHTGAKCGPNGKLVIAISDFEVPTTINFPPSLWSLYNTGSGPIARYQEIKAAYTNISNLSATTTSDTFTADGGEVDIWFFPTGSQPLVQSVTLPFSPASVGATQTAFRYSYLCNPQTLASNLDQQPRRIIGSSSVSVTLDFSVGPICYDFQYLDSSNVPVGSPGNVQVLTVPSGVQPPTGLHATAN